MNEEQAAAHIAHKTRQAAVDACEETGLLTTDVGFRATLKALVCVIATLIRVSPASYRPELLLWAQAAIAEGVSRAPETHPTKAGN